MTRCHLVMVIPLDLSDGFDQAALAREVRALEDQITGIVLSKGARVGTPSSALMFPGDAAASEPPAAPEPTP